MNRQFLKTFTVHMILQESQNYRVDARVLVYLPLNLLRSNVTAHSKIILMFNSTIIFSSITYISFQELLVIIISNICNNTYWRPRSLSRSTDQNEQNHKYSELKTAGNIVYHNKVFPQVHLLATVTTNSLQICNHNFPSLQSHTSQNQLKICCRT